MLEGRYALLSVASAGKRHAEFTARATSPTGQDIPLAVTLFIPEEAEFERQLEQIAIALRLDHPNLLRLLDGGRSTSTGTELLFVVSEPAGATLAQSSSEAPLEAMEARALTKDLLAGLEYIHAEGFVLGSLEPGTVVRAGTLWKLADLSQLRPRGAEGDDGPAGDVRSLGETLQAVLSADVRGTRAFEAIIAGCLEPDPLTRLTAGEIGRLLEDGVSNTDPTPAPPVERRYGPRVVVAAISLGALLLVGVLTVAALRKEPAARPAAATVETPGRAVSSPIRRPSPMAGEVEGKLSPTSPVSTAAPAPADPLATKAEPETRAAGEGAVGRANFAADSSNGRPTATGELFDNRALTAAHPSLPFGARVQVTNLRNGKSVVVRVNDRVPLGEGMVIMVTRAAAEQLGFARAGSARVRIEPAGGERN